MACYDCEDCKYSSYYGGKCKRFEYNCPFIIVENYSSQEVTFIRNVVEDISRNLNILNKIDEDGNHYLMYEDIDALTSRLSELKEKISYEIEQEWNEINR